VYEFRRESFTNLNEVEKIFLKKNDIIRRGIADVCKQMNVNNPLMTMIEN
jgi:sulfur transfer complex TusBCD TusB component (DsrH family)